MDKKRFRFPTCQFGALARAIFFVVHTNYGEICSGMEELWLFQIHLYLYLYIYIYIYLAYYMFCCLNRSMYLFTLSIEVFVFSSWLMLVVFYPTKIMK